MKRRATIPCRILASRWAAQTFGIEDAALRGSRPRPRKSIEIPGRPLVTMSLGVGENPAKRIADPFEAEIVGHLARQAHVLIDEGAGGEEAERVQRAVAKSGAPPNRVHTCRGSFAAFASAIARSDLYVGYDSAGQHIAAACGVPLLSIFAGFASPALVRALAPVGKGEDRSDLRDGANAGTVNSTGCGILKSSSQSISSMTTVESAGSE